jgi:hypothetical protein
MVIEYVHGHCATQNTVLYVNTHVCYGQLQLFTLHFVLSSGVLLCQVGGGGGLQGFLSGPLFLFGGGVQNHRRRRWVLYEFSIGLNRSS